MIEREQFSKRTEGREPEENIGQIDRLCSVVRLSGGRRSELAYLGWTVDGKPKSTLSRSGLTAKAQNSVDSFRISRLPIKEIDFDSLEVVEHVSVADPIDFKDMGRRKAEDLVNLVVNDGLKTRVVSVGEVAVLRAIVQAKENPWQDNSVSSRSGSIEARTMYCVFIPNPNSRENSGMAIIFDPIIAGESNETIFYSFVRQTLGKLLFLDELQESGNRKGYITKAAELTQAKPTGGMSDIFLVLRSLGLIDFEDIWLEELRRSSRNMTSLILGLFIRIDQEKVRRGNLPNYDVESMNLEKLFSLARNMLFVAQRQIS